MFQGNGYKCDLRDIYESYFPQPITGPWDTPEGAAVDEETLLPTLTRYVSEGKSASDPCENFGIDAKETLRTAKETVLDEIEMMSSVPVFLVDCMCYI